MRYKKYFLPARWTGSRRVTTLNQYAAPHFDDAPEVAALRLAMNRALQAGETVLKSLRETYEKPKQAEGKTDDGQDRQG